MLHRVYHTGGWHLSDGDQLTGGAFGVLRTLHLALDRLSGITSAYVVWDGARSSRRKSIYPEYKANRKGKFSDDFYDEFDNQKRLIAEALPLLGVKTAYLPAREGDDTIYWLSRLASSSVIVSDDKDMLCMLSPSVDVYRPNKEEYYTTETFTEAYGFSPDFYLYWKAIVGDTSDNIKGVKSVGEKRADAFIKQWYEGTLNEEAYASNKWFNVIVDNWETVERNIEMMDCSHERLTPSEIEHLKSVLTAPTSFEGDSFFNWAHKHKFYTMLDSVWTMPFKKLTDGRV